MTKNFILPLVLLYSVGCMSKAPDWLSQESSSASGIPTPEVFSTADLNQDNVIDRNESAAFSQSQSSIDFTTPLIVICSIIALIALCCSCSSIGFFFKNKYLQIKDLIFKK
jgi:hypothetical protein